MLKQTNRNIMKRFFKRIIDFCERRYSPLAHNHDSKYLKLEGGTLTGKVMVCPPEGADNAVLKSKFSGTNVLGKNTPDASLLSTKAGVSGLYSYDLNWWPLKYNYSGPADCILDGRAKGIVQQRLPANTDLNNIKSIGEYYNPETAEVMKFKNCPTVYAFGMHVFNTSGITQELTSYNPSENRKFIRTFYNNSWGKWVEVLTDYNMRKMNFVSVTCSVFIEKTSYYNGEFIGFDILSNYDVFGRGTTDSVENYNWICSGARFYYKDKLQPIGGLCSYQESAGDTDLIIGLFSTNITSFIQEKILEYINVDLIYYKK